MIFDQMLSYFQNMSCFLLMQFKT